MKLKMRYDWRLRELMAEREMWKTTDLSPLLAERGITMSPAQIHRLVTTKPVRLSLDLLAALCDIFDCEPGALVNISVADTAQQPAVGGEQFGEWADRRPRRPPPADLGPAAR